MSSNLVAKKEDSGAFTIPCTIGAYQFAQAFFDLRATINLMPFTIFKEHDLGAPSPATVRLLMTI